MKKLPQRVQEEIVFEHPPSIRNEPYSSSDPLVGTLKGERSYHFGRNPEYRIIYYVENDLVTVTIIGTRVEPLIPIRTLQDRVKAWEEVTGRANGD